MVRGHVGWEMVICKRTPFSCDYTGARVCSSPSPLFRALAPLTSRVVCGRGFLLRLHLRVALHGDFVEGITQVQTKKKASLAYYA